MLNHVKKKLYTLIAAQIEIVAYLKFCRIAPFLLPYECLSPLTIVIKKNDKLGLVLLQRHRGPLLTQLMYITI